MHVTLNGQSAEVVASDVAALLEERGIDAGASGVAVAVNGRVIARARWSEQAIAEGDRIEVITAMQGG
jgi:sulfur carrier protein